MARGPTQNYAKKKSLIAVDRYNRLRNYGVGSLNIHVVRTEPMSLGDTTEFDLTRPTPLIGINGSLGLSCYKLYRAGND